MTPKEKAKELVYKYQYLVNTWDCYNDESLEMIYRLPSMKECALIAVDLIIYHTEEDSSNIDLYQFYSEVKKEIKNL